MNHHKQCRTTNTKAVETELIETEQQNWRHNSVDWWHHIRIFDNNSFFPFRWRSYFFIFCFIFPFLFSKTILCRLLFREQRTRTFILYLILLSIYHQSFWLELHHIQPFNVQKIYMRIIIKWLIIRRIHWNAANKFYRWRRLFFHFDNNG